MQKIRKKSLMRVIGISIIVTFIISLFHNNSSVLAGTNSSYELGIGDTSYVYDDLLTKYKTSSNIYNQNIVSYQIEFYNNDLTIENYYSIESQYGGLVNKRAELQETKDLYLEYKKTTDDETLLTQINSQIETINSQLEQYDNSIASAKISMAEAKLQKQIAQFYVDNKNLVLQQAQNKLTNDFQKKIYNLMVTKEQLEYYSAYQEYLVIVEKVEQIKYNRGLSNSYSLDLAKVNLSKNNLQMNQYSNAYNDAISYIKNETKIGSSFKIVLPIIMDEKNYDLEAMISEFEKSNSSLAQCKHLKQCYQEYLYANYGTYTLYKQIEQRIRDYTLQYDGLKNNIRLYVSEAILSYHTAFDNLVQADKELQLANKNFNIITAKREHKRATDLEASKAKYELQAAQVSYYQRIYDIIIWQDILEKHIIDATP